MSESKIITRNDGEIVITLVCKRSHQWDSTIVGYCHDGPVFKDFFCPECTLPGKRIAITAEDCAGVITEEQASQIGEDAMPVFGYVLLNLMAIPQGEDRRQTFTLRNLCENVQDVSPRVIKALERLRHFGYLQVEEIAESSNKLGKKYAQDALQRRFRCELGDQVSLIRPAESYKRIITL